MFPIQDQISVATKNSLEANLAMYTSLSNKMLESVEQLINLNMTAVRASMEESSAATKQMLSAKDPQEFMSALAAQAKPGLEKALAYGSHVANIATSARAEFSKVAEVQIASVTGKVNELVEEVTRKAPAGSEALVTMMKSAMGNANGGYEQFAKTAKQAMETIQANMNTAVSQFAQGAAR